MEVRNTILRSTERKKKVLAVASSGGHWTQLLRVTPTLTNYEIVFVTVLESYRAQVPDNKVYIVGDANRWHKLALVGLGFHLAWIVAKEKPDVVISTGAAPGYFAMLFGNLFHARTIWIDSITNIERLSLSGSLAGKHTDLWLTQWPHLAKTEGPHYGGSVL
jgi:UDP-N-acetylglucosamine:LPS N-acetylglucosamine transferase